MKHVGFFALGCAFSLAAIGAEQKTSSNSQNTDSSSFYAYNPTETHMDSEQEEQEKSERRQKARKKLRQEAHFPSVGELRRSN